MLTFLGCHSRLMVIIGGIENFILCQFVYGKILGWTSMDADLCPTVCSFFEMVEENADNNIVEVALEVGKVPHIKEGAKRMVEKFQKKQGLKKNK